MTTIDISLKAVEQLARLDENGGTCDTQFIGYAATLRALSTALTQSRAETAAAYEQIANEVFRWSIAASEEIRVLTTTESTAALNMLIAEAEAWGMRRAAVIAYQFEGNDKMRRAILAAIPKGGDA